MREQVAVFLVVRESIRIDDRIAQNCGGWLCQNRHHARVLLIAAPLQPRRSRTGESRRRKSHEYWDDKGW